MIRIVDTNVAVTANGRMTHAEPACVVSCVEALEAITREGKIALDSDWLILKEYLNNLRSTGQPGVGDGFLKWVLSNWRNPQRCDLVQIAQVDGGSFLEFPSAPDLATFDLADRKFVAVARAHQDHPPILQATDSKWRDYERALKREGVIVSFLCDHSDR